MTKPSKQYSLEMEEVDDDSIDHLPEKKEGPVECLGMTFESDEKRREHFLGILKEKLKDPEFRKIEGFPIGEDKDILALSDPPYYTACPNPFIEDFIKQYGTPYDPNVPYSKEPFAADVSEGKNDPIYNAHSYHTKVPHKAIMRYILHYTEPGDIVFDGFCGTGMTGVAAQMCGDKKAVESLGVTKESPDQKYKVKKDGTILEKQTDENGKETWTSFSKLGPRRAVLNDLSPAATFIAYNYNTPVDVNEFERKAKRILKEVEAECGWMYETKHTDGRTGKINYTVWSDVFVCPECMGEVIFWEVAVNKDEGKVMDDFHCPHCNKWLSKSPANKTNEDKKPFDQRRIISSKIERSWTNKYDKAINQTIKQAKQVPVLINYSVSIPGKKTLKRFEKIPDEFDLELIEKIENSDIPYWYPTEELPDGFNTRQPKGSHGITHVHHFYTKRNLWVLSSLFDKCIQSQQKLLFQSIVATLCSRLVRYNMGKRGNGPLNGTLYVSSLNAETEILKVFKGKEKDFIEAFLLTDNNFSFCQSIENISVNESKVDYIFIDPPFGANINYSELNFLWESWLKVWTNNKPEAIENSVQGKGPNEYRQLMASCFKEAYRVLKPGRWMTVEFSNTKASVWNNIQVAITEAGFIVANVSALDKKQGSFKAVTTPTAVKQDLIISAYKPNGGFEERFLKEVTTEEGVWDFVRTHMKYLPITKKQAGDMVPVPERDPRILFDQVVAYYVRKGYPVPISSPDFQLGLHQRFPQRDNMFFLPEQVAEYDKKRITAKEILQMKLFVFDESSAIQWLKQQLTKKPQTFQDIHPDFIREIGGWQKHEKPLELSQLLEQNFLRYDGRGEVPGQIHGYLSSNFKDLRNLTKDDITLKDKAKDRWYVPDPNKAGDLEKLRERSLLKEFDEYKQFKGRKMKVFRVEAVRAGFKKAWQEHDYSTIISVAEKIPDNVLQEDPKLLMWYDQAMTRTGG